MGQVLDLVLKRILIMTWRDIKNPRSGGGDEVIHRIAKHLAEKGNEVHLLCSRFPKSKKNEEIEGVKILRHGSEYTLPITGFFHLVRNSMKKPDLILEVINVIPWFVPLYSKIPEIAFIHQIQTQQLKGRKSSSFSHEFNLIGRTLVLFFERLIPIIYKKIDFITVSDSIKKEMVALGIKKDKINVVNNGIDNIEEDTRIKKTTNPTILYLGRLKKYKGVQYLLESLREIIKTKSNVELRIVGKGDYEKELKKLVLKYHLQSNVKFLGYISDEEKYKIIQSSWFLAIASLNEGWCIPVIEAGALGIPTVAFANGGLNDSIIHNVTGLLVESENIDELTRKIIQLIENKELRIRLGNNAKNYSSKFSWSNQLEKFSKCVENINWSH